MKVDTSELRRTSALFWFTLIIPIGIIGVGVNFILNPVGASAAYGVAISDPNSFPFMWIKGIRDIFSGLVILPFLLNGNRKVTAIFCEVLSLTCEEPDRPIKPQMISPPVRKQFLD